MLNCDSSQAQANVLIKQKTAQTPDVQNVSFKAEPDTFELKNRQEADNSQEEAKKQIQRVHKAAVSGGSGWTTIILGKDATLLYALQSPEKIAMKHGLDPKNTEDMKKAQEIKDAKVRASAITNVVFCAIGVLGALAFVLYGPKKAL